MPCITVPYLANFPDIPLPKSLPSASLNLNPLPHLCSLPSAACGRLEAGLELIYGATPAIQHNLELVLDQAAEMAGAKEEPSAAAAVRGVAPARSACQWLTACPLGVLLRLLGLLCFAERAAGRAAASPQLARLLIMCLPCGRSRCSFAACS